MAQVCLAWDRRLEFLPGLNWTQWPGEWTVLWVSEITQEVNELPLATLLALILKPQTDTSRLFRSTESAHTPGKMSEVAPDGLRGDSMFVESSERCDGLRADSTGR